MRRLALVVGRPSASAKILAEALGIKRVAPSRIEGLSQYLSVLNWGMSSLRCEGKRVLNKAEAIRNAVDKTKAFDLVPESLRPCYSPLPFLPRSGILLARANGSAGGRGIVVVRRGEIPPDADFYVEYLPKVREYRVHVAFGRVIHVQQKRKRRETEYSGDESLIRNHSNGWVFAENEVTYPSLDVEEKVRHVAVTSVAALGLDFAAVDLIVEKGTDRVVFLEANTRPGLESTRSVAAYKEAFLPYVYPVRR